VVWQHIQHNCSEAQLYLCLYEFCVYFGPSREIK